MEVIVGEREKALVEPILKLAIEKGFSIAELRAVIRILDRITNLIEDKRNSSPIRNWEYIAKEDALITGTPVTRIKQGVDTSNLNELLNGLSDLALNVSNTHVAHLLKHQEDSGIFEE